MAERDDAGRRVRASASEDAGEELQRRAEQILLEYLDLRLGGSEPPTRAEFLAAQPEELRPRIASLFDDLEWATGAAGGERAKHGALLGDYRLIRELGAGGMGTVWEAEQVSLGRRVAVKLLRASLLSAPKALERFEREASITARLQHPAIVSIHAIDLEADSPLIAAELVEGGRTLATWFEELRRMERLPAEHFTTVGRMFLTIAEALQAVHAAQVIHRDVKPSNILLTPDGRPKIADFGLAHLEGDAPLSLSGDLVGTPHYLSPEQISTRSDALDDRTDVFSLGATLYEALTLVRAFGDGPRAKVLDAVARDEPAAPRRLQPRIPRDLETICLKAMEKRREHRYASMADLAADLRRFLAHEPILARRPGELVRLAKWAQRHPARALSAAVCLVGLISLAWLWVTADERAVRSTVVDLTAARSLVERADRLWPASAHMIPVYEQWIDAAGELTAAEPRYREALARSQRGRALLAVEGSESLLGRSALEREVRRKEALLAEREGALQAGLRYWSGRAARSRARVLSSRDLPDDALSRLRAARVRAFWDREILGEEALALDYAWLAWNVAPESFKYQCYDVIAWALSGLGREEEAAAMLRRSVLTVPMDERAIGYVVRQTRRFEIHSGQQGPPLLLHLLQREIELLERETRSGRARLRALGDGAASQLEETFGRLSVLMQNQREPLGESPDYGLTIARRLEKSREASARESSAAYARDWQRIIDTIGDPERCPLYRGLRIEVQRGLLPLGIDPRSGLAEFLVLGSGDDPDSAWETGVASLRAGDGIVLILVPGGSFRMGAQSIDPESPNYDPDAHGGEAPVRRVTVSPYFLSKYEVTRAQWREFMGSEAKFDPNTDVLPPDRDSASAAYPVAWVTWHQVDTFARRAGLRLPTEAEWEYAVRAGTTTRNWAGETDEDLYVAGALLGDSAETVSGMRPTVAPVDSFAPNPFGFHGMFGNVWEWLQDRTVPPTIEPQQDPQGGLRDERRRLRGGSYEPDASRSDYRASNGTQDFPERAFREYGFRVARSLTSVRSAQ